MGRILKWVIGSLVSLIFLVGLVIFLLVSFIDLNSLKPRIETLAKEKAAIDLRILGELSWSFYPYLGIELGELQIRPLATPDAPALASIQKAAAGVAITPLLKGEIKIKQIHLIQPEIYLHRNAQGVANWELVQKSLANTVTEDEEKGIEKDTTKVESTTNKPTQPLDLNLAIADIWLDRAAIHIEDEVENLDLQLTDVSLRAKNVSLDSTFPIELSAKLSLAEPATHLDLNLTSQVKLDLKSEHYGLNQLKAKLIASYPEMLATPITLTLDARVDAQLTKGEVHAPLTLNLTSPDWKDSSLPAIGPVKLQLDSNLDLNQQHYFLNDLTLLFDATQFKGNASVNLDNQAIVARLAGNQLDADRYLPATTKEATGNQKEKPTETTDEERLPVELLKTLNLDLGFTLDQLKISGLTIENIDLALIAKNGLIDLQKANLDLYEGTFRNKAQVNVRKNLAQLSLTTQLNDLNLRPLLDDLKQESLPLRGKLTVNGSFTTQGTRLSEWLSQSNGKGDLRLLEGAITGMNISKEVCLAAAAIEGRSSNKVWSEDTEFTSLQADIDLVQGKLNNKELTLGIPGFEVSGYGFYHLVSAKLLYNLGVRFDQNADQQSCPVSSTLAEFRWPVECKGSLAGETPIIKCRPDTKAVTQLVGQKIKTAAKQETDKFKEEAEEKIKAEEDRLKRKLKEEANEKLRSFFK